MNNLPANSGHSRGRGRGKKTNEEINRVLAPQLVCNKNKF